MKNFNISKKKIDALASAVLLLGIGVLFLTNYWWPGMLIVIWAYLGMKQWLSNRKFDLVISSVILLGLYIIWFLDISMNVLVPVLFFLGGLYIIFREFFFSEDTNGEDIAEELRDDADIYKK